MGEIMNNAAEQFSSVRIIQYDWRDIWRALWVQV